MDRDYVYELTLETVKREIYKDLFFEMESRGVPRQDMKILSEIMPSGGRYIYKVQCIGKISVMFEWLAMASKYHKKGAFVIIAERVELI